MKVMPPSHDLDSTSVAAGTAEAPLANGAAPLNSGRRETQQEGNASPAAGKTRGSPASAFSKFLGYLPFRGRSRRRRVPFIHQVDRSDCGAACLGMVAAYHGRRYSNQTLRELCGQDRQGASLNGMARGAEKIGFRTLLTKAAFEGLKTGALLPCIIFRRPGHFAVLTEIRDGKVRVADPGIGVMEFTEAEFAQTWLNLGEKGSRTAIALLLEPSPAFLDNDIEDAPEASRFRMLKPYLGEYRQALFQLAFGAVVMIAAQAMSPYMNMALIDAGLSGGNARLVYLVIMGQLVLSLSQVSVSLFQTWLMSLTGIRVNLRLVSNFLMKLAKLPMGFFDSRVIGDLTQRIRDHERIQDFLTQNVVNLFLSFLTLTVFGAVLAAISWQICVVFAIGSAVHLLAIITFLKRRRVLDTKNFLAMAQNQGVALEYLLGMQEIKLNNAEQQKRWQWEESQYKIYDVAIKSMRLGQLEQSAVAVVSELKNLSISFLCAQQVLSGHISLGAMISIQFMVGQLNFPLTQIVQLMKKKQECGLSLQRAGEIHAVADEERPEQGAAPGNPCDITINSLDFKYTGTRDRLVLQDVNLHIPHGRTTAIVGSTGSGKTTLLKLLLKFYEPSDGRINLGPLNLNDVAPGSWREQCGVVMQDGYVFSDTIAQNIAIGQEKPDKSRLTEVARIAQIHEFIETLPLRYETRIGRDGVALSKGQLQRVLLARALYRDPQYLFLDEATSALDAETESVVVSHLRQALLGKTVVVIAHRLSTVMHADQIVVLEKGRIIEQGPHGELVSAKGRYYGLIRNQLELGE